MKVCYIGWGHSIHMQRIAKWFAQRGHQIHLITDNPVHLNDVAVHDIRWKKDDYMKFVGYFRPCFNIYRKIKLFESLSLIGKLVKRIDPEILHLQTLYYPSYLGAFTNFRPLIITPWNGDVLWEPKRSAYHKMVVKYSLKKADLITTNSHAMWERCLSLNIKESKLRMIQWTGVNLRQFSPRSKNSELRNKLNLDITSPVVLSTRSLGAIYNVDIVIKAIPVVLREIPETKFVFVWHSGDGLREIKELIDKLAVGHAVRLAGKVNHDEMPMYYNMADVLVSVSSCDTTPTSLLEAMASGTPPVTADLKPVNETVKDGWNGFIVPQRDPGATAKAIIELLKNRNLRRLFAERNLSLVKKMADYDKEMTKMEDMYISMAKKAALRHR